MGAADISPDVAGTYIKTAYLAAGVAGLWVKATLTASGATIGAARFYGLVLRPKY